MKFISILIATLFFQFITLSKEIDLISKVEEVTIYHSGALVKRTSHQNLEIGLNELIIKNISSKTVLTSLKINNKEVTILNKELIKKLSKEDFSQLIDRRDAIIKQIDLIELKYEEPGFVKKVEELETMIAFYSKRIVSLKKELREVNIKIEQAKKVENIDLENEDAGILRLVVSVENKFKDLLKIEYVCGGIGWSPSYEVTVNNSSDKTIKIKYLAKVMSQTGENWDDVSISLSSSFPLESPTKLPVSDSPWTLNGRGLGNEPTLNQATNQQDKIEKLEGVTYLDINVPSFLDAKILNGNIL